MSGDSVSEAGGAPPFEWDAAHCPFCNSDATDWDVDPCAHLIADFGDGSDGDRGILCGSAGSRCGNPGLDGLDEIEAALGAFSRAVGPEFYVANSPSDSDVARLINVLGYEAKWPEWLSAAIDQMRDGQDPGDLVVEAAWRAAVPWSEGLQEKLSSIGTMAATMVTFVWAADREAGIAQMRAAIHDASSRIEVLTDRLAASQWSR